METDKLYRAIFERRSVRKYEQAPLDEKTLEDISSFMSDLMSALARYSHRTEVHER